MPLKNSTETIAFDIPLDVRPKQGCRRGYGRGGPPHYYTPGAIRRNAQSLALLAAQYRPPEPLAGPLALSVEFSFPPRACDRRRIQRAGRLPKHTLPDLDNLLKQYLDVLQRAGFFTNDGQIVRMEATKWWAASPGVRVKISKCPGTAP